MTSKGRPTITRCLERLGLRLTETKRHSTVAKNPAVGALYPRGVEGLAHSFSGYSTEAIRASADLRRRSDGLLEVYAPSIWTKPNESGKRSWLYSVDDEDAPEDVTELFWHIDRHKQVQAFLVRS